MNNNIFEQEISAEELYKELQSFGKLNALTKHCIFRGVASNNCKLLPSIFRSETQKKWNNKNYDLTKNSGQIKLEKDILINFYEIANKHGLSIPDIKDILKNQENYWPNKKLIPFIAIAQHYGTPTRLLDWSYDYKVAMYFAAINACETFPENTEKCNDDYMVIWAMKKDILENTDEEAILQIIVPVYANNPNLYAQKGVFTYVQWHAQTDIPIQIQPLEQYEQLEFHKFKIPYTDRFKLLALLNNDGINAASIFPGYNGVSKALCEQKFYVNGDL